MAALSGLTPDTRRFFFKNRRLWNPDDGLGVLLDIFKFRIVLSKNEAITLGMCGFHVGGFVEPQVCLFGAIDDHEIAAGVERTRDTDVFRTDGKIA